MRLKRRMWLESRIRQKTPMDTFTSSTSIFQIFQIREFSCFRFEEKRCIISLPIQSDELIRIRLQEQNYQSVQFWMRGPDRTEDISHDKILEDCVLPVEEYGSKRSRMELSGPKYRFAAKLFWLFLGWIDAKFRQKTA